MDTATLQESRSSTNRVSRKLVPQRPSMPHSGITLVTSCKQPPNYNGKLNYCFLTKAGIAYPVGVGALM